MLLNVLQTSSTEIALLLLWIAFPRTCSEKKEHNILGNMDLRKILFFCIFCPSVPKVIFLKSKHMWDVREINLAAV